MISTFSAESRITREGGEKLRKMIIDLAKVNAKIILDFKNQPIASVSFWDEGIAKLIAEGWDRQRIEDQIEFRGLHPRDREIFEKLIQARSK